MLAADTAEPITSAGHAQLGIAVLAGIAVIVLLITKLQAARLPGADHRVTGARRLRRGAPRQGHRQLHRRSRLHRGGRRRADRARRDPRQDARRLRRRRPGRRHHPRQVGRCRAAGPSARGRRAPGWREVDAVGDGADRLRDRASAVLRGRRRPADPGRAHGRQARQLLPDADRHSRARRSVRDARTGPAAPRPARRDRRRGRQPGRDAGPRRPDRHPHRDHRRSGLRPVRGPLGRRPGPRPDDPAARLRRAGQAPELRRHPGHHPAAGRADARQGAGGHRRRRPRVHRAARLRRGLLRRSPCSRPSCSASSRWPGPPGSPRSGSRGWSRRASRPSPASC
ncbi:hypothetical protein SGLAM104S_08220 [Streptomyces glaucescens]